MSDKYIFTNNAKSTLAVALGGGDATLQVVAGEGALFPNPTPGSEQFRILVKEGNTKALMSCTTRATDVLTISRTDSYSFNVGATVMLVLDAVILSTFLQKAVYRTCTGDPNGVETAEYAGEEIYDTVGLDWWKATPDGTVWKLMSS
jgi:hypothetical protein